MKTISIDDDIYKKLRDAKQSLHSKSFSALLRKIFSEDRVSWVHRLAGNVDIDEKRIGKLESQWQKWHIRKPAH